MNIKWYGGSSFYIKTKSGNLLIDPGDAHSSPSKKEVNFKLLSHPDLDDDDYSAKLTVSEPGEYEADGIIVEAFHAGMGQDEEGQLDPEDTNIFSIRDEGMNLVHMGVIDHDISDELQEQLGTVDILMVPAGNQDVLDAEEADDLMRVLEPRVVIPYHYKAEGLDVDTDSEEDVVDVFSMNPEKTDKLKLSRSSLPDDSTDLYLIEPWG